MSADHIYKNNIHQSGSGSQGSPKEMGQGAPSVEPVLKESSTPSTKPEDKSSSALSDLRPGVPGNITVQGTNKLIAYLKGVRGIEVTPEQAAKLQTAVYGLGKGYASTLPAKCKGQQCPLIESCPIYRTLGSSALPIGSPCPVEMTIIDQWINKHLPALGIEDPDAPEHSFDMDLIHELAGQALIQWRCSALLSEDQAMMEERQVSGGEMNDKIFQVVINPALEIMERAGRNIGKIRDALVATREAQIKAGKDASDGSQKAASAKDRIKNALKITAERNKEMRKKGIESANNLALPNEKLKNAEFEVLEDESTD